MNKDNLDYINNLIKSSNRSREEKTFKKRNKRIKSTFNEVFDSEFEGA